MGFDFQGKVALVTGAGGRRGIGRAAALRLAREGANLVLVDIPWPADQRAFDERDGWDGVVSVARELESLGRHALVLHADVSDADEVQAAVDRAVTHFGRIDILVANAAARPGGDRVPVLELSVEDFERVIRVNLLGTFFCCKAVGAYMARAGAGAVVLVSSLSGRIGKPRMAAYAASKFGQIGFMQSFAHEMAAHGVRVNAVAPGAVDTARLDWSAQGPSVQEPAPGARELLLAQQAQGIPLGRVAAPEDVSGVIAFLCSDDARHITGQVLGIDGGARM